MHVGEQRVLIFSSCMFELTVHRFAAITDGQKGFPTLLVVAPVASGVIVLLVVSLIWWRRKRRIIGNFYSDGSVLLLLHIEKKEKCKIIFNGLNMVLYFDKISKITVGDV